MTRAARRAPAADPRLGQPAPPRPARPGRHRPRRHPRPPRSTRRPRRGELPRACALRLAARQGRGGRRRSRTTWCSPPTPWSRSAAGCSASPPTRAEAAALPRAALRPPAPGRHRRRASAAASGAGAAPSRPRCASSGSTPREIAAYLASGEWQGKAGGYAIQGRAGGFVPWIGGSYSNVVGLPLDRDPRPARRRRRRPARREGPPDPDRAAARRRPRRGADGRRPARGPPDRPRPRRPDAAARGDLPRRARPADEGHSAASIVDLGGGLTGFLRGAAACRRRGGRCSCRSPAGPSPARRRRSRARLLLKGRTAILTPGAPGAQRRPRPARPGAPRRARRRSPTAAMAGAGPGPRA